MFSLVYHWSKGLLIQKSALPTITTSRAEAAEQKLSRFGYYLQFYHKSFERPWAKHFRYLSFSFPIYKIVINILLSFVMSSDSSC